MNADFAMRRWVVVCTAVMLTFAGSCREESATVCVPGATQPCVCPNGAGAQSCNGSGTGYEPCRCASPQARSPEPSMDAMTAWVQVVKARNRQHRDRELAGYADRVCFAGASVGKDTLRTLLAGRSNASSFQARVLRVNDDEAVFFIPKAPLPLVQLRRFSQEWKVVAEVHPRRAKCAAGMFDDMAPEVLARYGLSSLPATSKEASGRSARSAKATNVLPAGVEPEGCDGSHWRPPDRYVLRCKQPPALGPGWRFVAQGKAQLAGLELVAGGWLRNGWLLTQTRGCSGPRCREPVWRLYPPIRAPTCVGTPPCKRFGLCGPAGNGCAGCDNVPCPMRLRAQKGLAWP